MTVIDYSPPAPGAKIIIVGGGCFGLSTAYALALKKQYEIYVFERQAIPSTDAASSGKSVISLLYNCSLHKYIYRY